MFRRVIGAPQHYDWGDPTFIPELFQVPSLLTTMGGNVVRDSPRRTIET